MDYPTAIVPTRQEPASSAATLPPIGLLIFPAGHRLHRPAATSKAVSAGELEPPHLRLSGEGNC